MSKLATGDIWQATIAVIRAHFGVLVAIAAPFTLLVDMVMTLFGPVVPTTIAAFTPQVVLVLVILPGMVGAIAQLAVARLVALPDDMPRAALAAAFVAFPAYAGAILLSALPTGFGFVLFIIPGLYLMARLFLVLPVVVVERLPIVATLQRSWTLTDGNAWPIMLFLALMLLFLLGASALGSGVGMALASVLTLLGMKAVGGFVAALIGATVAMLASIGSAAAATVIYLKLR